VAPCLLVTVALPPAARNSRALRSANDSNPIAARVQFAGAAGGRRPTDARIDREADFLVQTSNNPDPGLDLSSLLVVSNSSPISSNSLDAIHNRDIRDDLIAAEIIGGELMEPEEKCR
jgi:hypothetical protein